jgi:hypothetical protein
MIVLQLQTKEMMRKVKRKVLDYIPTLLSIIIIDKPEREEKLSISDKKNTQKIVYLMIT